MARGYSSRPHSGEKSIPPQRAEETACGSVTQQAQGDEGAYESRYEAFLELAPEAVIVLNASGGMVLVNRQTERLFGYDRASLLDRHVETLIPGPTTGEHPLLSASDTPAPHIPPLGSGLRRTGRRKDGSEFPVEISLSRTMVDGEPWIIATIHDLSELERVEAERAALAKANQEQGDLLALADTALSSLALDDLLRELLLRVQEATQADNVAILLLDEEAQELDVCAARGIEEAVIGKVRVPAGKGFAGRIIATRAPLIVDDFTTFPVVNPILRELRSSVGVPLIAGERVIGVLHVDSMEPCHFGNQDIHALELVAERIAQVIDRARLLEAAQAARAEAERERARWQAAVNHAPAFVITCDADLRPTSINPAFERLLGPRADLSTPPEELPRRFGLLLPDGSGPVSPDLWPLTRAVRERRDIYGVELLYRDPSSGEERLLMWNASPMRAGDGAILGGVTVGWDITEQRRLERAAREHAAQLEAIFEAITDGVIVYDTEGRIILSNAEARAQMARFVANMREETLSERNRGTLVTDESGKPIPAEQWAPSRVLRGEVISGANPMMSVVRTLDGEEVFFSTTGAPLRDATGRITGAVTVNADVTARKRLEREREQARARELAALEVSQRLDEFFAIAAHDIRNPVTTVYTNVQMQQRRLRRLQADLADKAVTQAATLEAFEKSVSSARQSVERLIRLIDRLFDIAQARAGKLELLLALCDLAAITREQVAAQRAAHPERVIALELAKDQPVMVNADAVRVGEVLANYLSNAIKYAPAERPITVWLEVAGERARVAVRDEGPGLSPERRELIWEKFHRAPEVAALNLNEAMGQGTSLGLGLHICKQLVEAHPGGQVGVESEEGAGSTFWFSLPLAEEPSDSDATD